MLDSHQITPPNFRKAQTLIPWRIIKLAHRSSVPSREQLVYRLCFENFLTEYRISLLRSPIDCPQLFNQQPNAALVRGPVSAWLRRRFAANISTRTDCEWKIEVNGPCFVARMPLMTWLEKLYLVRALASGGSSCSPLRNNLISRTALPAARSSHLFLNLPRLP